MKRRERARAERQSFTLETAVDFTHDFGGGGVSNFALHLLSASLTWSSGEK